jgi:hypothetical protein
METSLPAKNCTGQIPNGPRGANEEAPGVRVMARRSFKPVILHLEELELEL